MKTFEDLTKDEVAGILNTAMDSGDWHTPSASDINIKEQSKVVVYGWCNISLHNRYHDVEFWFNINANTVHIWEKQYRKGKSDLCLHRRIYNLRQLSDRLSELELKKSLSNN